MCNKSFVNPWIEEIHEHGVHDTRDIPVTPRRDYKIPLTTSFDEGADACVPRDREGAVAVREGGLCPRRDRRELSRITEYNRARASSIPSNPQVHRHEGFVLLMLLLLLSLLLLYFYFIRSLSRLLALTLREILSYHCQHASMTVG